MPASCRLDLMSPGSPARGGHPHGGGEGGSGAGGGATGVGEVCGGYAVNTVEQRMKKETVYHVDLRMDDGSTMRLEHASPLWVGAHVTVNNGVITP